MSTPQPSTSAPAPAPAARTYTLTAASTTNTIICNEAVLQGGRIYVGGHSIIHPRAQILANSIPIIIGNNVIIEEHSIINSDAASTTTLLSSHASRLSAYAAIIAAGFSPSEPCLVIGDYSWIEVGSIVRQSIGKHCHLFARSVVDGDISWNSPAPASTTPQASVITIGNNVRLGYGMQLQSASLTNSIIEWLQVYQQRFASRKLNKVNNTQDYGTMELENISLLYGTSIILPKCHELTILQKQETETSVPDSENANNSNPNKNNVKLNEDIRQWCDEMNVRCELLRERLSKTHRLIK